MTQSQKKLNINVSFENELAQYLIDMAEIENKTIQEVLVDFVKEEFEAGKLSEEDDDEDDDEIDEVDIELAKLSLERDARGDEEIRSENVDWGRILSAKMV